ncbi:MAG TPA: hypothetical protein VFR63_02885 [Gaiellaceae bacterium]|nr:hypothetical protein [Gaiellaceae bacterium]
MRAGGRVKATAPDAGRRLAGAPDRLRVGLVLRRADEQRSLTRLRSGGAEAER